MRLKHFGEKVSDVFSIVFGIVGMAGTLVISAFKGLYSLIVNRVSKDDEDNWVPSPRKPVKKVAAKTESFNGSNKDLVAKHKTTAKPKATAKPKSAIKPKPPVKPKVTRTAKAVVKPKPQTKKPVEVSD